MFLHEARVVAQAAKKIFAATVAAKQAAAINRCVRQIFLRGDQQIVHVLRGGGGVATLKLDRLTRARQRANGEHAGIRIAADQLAHEKIAAMKISRYSFTTRPMKRLPRACCCSAGGN